MPAIPTAVLSEHFQARMEGRVLKAGVFLTFAFDPGFFEQEVLPVFLDVPLSHQPAVRLIQLEEAIRQRVDGLAVYYDPRALSDETEGSKLDVLRIPVLWRTGYFHPKNVLLLVEDEEPNRDGLKEQRLLFGTLSANLTRSGWWENVEVCHVEELRIGEKSSVVGDLDRLCGRIRRAASTEADHSALSRIEQFVRKVDERLQSTSGGRLHPRLYVGAVDGRGAGQSVPDFLSEVRGRELHGANLEVISPFFDDSDAGPLRELIERFEPRETRVYLPLAADGKAECGKPYFETVRRLTGVSWAKLPADLLRSGRDESAAPRRVHAKVYRFFRRDYEAVFLGSVNLSGAAHQKGGNFETALLIEPELEGAPDWWLSVDRTKPAEFLDASESDETSGQGPGVALALRFSWDSRQAEACWTDQGTSPRLEIDSLNSHLFSLGPLSPGTWVALGSSESEALADVLRRTSLVSVRVEGHAAAPILVQESGMVRKPSILLNLSVADILKCWAALTPEQKAVLLEERFQELSQTDSALLPGAPLGRLEEGTLFDAFAGVFHAFGSLERNVFRAFEGKRWNEAVHLLFGQKYDSLPHLLEKVLDEPASGSGDSGARAVRLEAVNRYVILLCARQLLQRVLAEAPEAFRADHRDDLQRLEGVLGRKAEVEAELNLGSAEDRAKFLRWFESWFLRRAVSVEEATS
jgi:hypothetical protein